MAGWHEQRDLSVRASCRRAVVVYLYPRKMVIVVKQKDENDEDHVFCPSSDAVWLLPIMPGLGLGR